MIKLVFFTLFFLSEAILASRADAQDFVESQQSSTNGGRSIASPGGSNLQPSTQYPGYYICAYGGATYYNCNESGVPANINNNNILDRYGSSSKADKNSGGVQQLQYTADDLRDCQNAANKSIECIDILDHAYSNKTPDELSGESKGFNAATCESGQTRNEFGICEPNQNQTPNNQQTATVPDLYQCSQAKVNADSACDSESKNWMRTINQVSGLLSSQLNQGACGTLSAAQAGSAASLTLFSMQCGNAVSECLTECRKTIADTNASTDPTMQQMNKDAAGYASACNAKGASAKKTEADVGSGIQQIAQAVQACRASFGTAAVDPVQIPDYVAKPQGDILAGLQPRNDQGLNHEGTGSGLTGDMNSNIDLSDLIDDSPPAVAAKPRGMGQDPGGQQGSAGLGGGGGVGVDAGSGRAANRKGNTGLLSNILSGFFGGGGGGLFGGGRNNNGNRGQGDGGQFAAAPGGLKTPDLRQFLPGAKFDPKKQRGIAGQIVSKDGIMGPHGNLWRDVSNRYQVKRASLLP